MLENHKIIISVHSVLYGAADALEEYLVSKKVQNLLTIRLPFHIERRLRISSFIKGEENKKYIASSRKSLGFIDYFLDIYSVISTILKGGNKYDVFIGVDNLNAVCGLFLKKIGNVKKVIFYGIDFVPVRFKNPILNYIYHKLEAIAVKNSDEVWNVSPRMATGRQKFLNISSKRYKQKVVPIGVWNKRIKKTSFSDVKKNQLLFLGAIIEKQGIQKVVEAVPVIIKKIPNFKFIIIGWGEYENELKKIVKAKKIEKYVEFKGLIKDRSKLDNMMSASAFAIAPYAPLKDGYYNFTYYADPTKIKDYLSAGLPVLLTDLPYNAYDIEKSKCGIVVKYDPNSIANAVIKLMSSPKLLKKYRENALNYSKQFDWNNVFNEAFKLYV